MKIISCSIFFDENDIFEIKYQTETNWVDEIHILETNNTFRKDPKPYNFAFDGADENGKLKYHQFDSKKLFIKNNIFGKLRLAYKRFLPSFYQKIITHPS